jgi:NADH-quinone oxidoreductase subunit N
MNTTLMTLEIAVGALAIGVLLLDLWLPKEDRRWLGRAAAGVLGLLLFMSFTDAVWDGKVATAFHGAYVLDGTAMFFKRFFLVAAILVLVMAAEFADRFISGVPEFFSLILFALTGMMFASSANDFMMMFVSLELITVTFYVLVSFQRERTQSLEAGAKYLILGALSSGVLVYGIALVYGAAGTMSFEALDAKLKSSHGLAHSGLFQCGVLMVLAGLTFKLAAVPFQFWAPDVYQGAPAPVTAFLAVGSKAAGVALLGRLIWGALPEVHGDLERPLMAAAGLTILYGSLCAIPQRNLKRLLGYTSIASAGFVLLGFSMLTTDAFGAVAYYLGAWLFAVVTAFAVVCVVSRETGSDDIAALAGLHQRSPWLAVTLTLAVVSLAGVPPLAGFFGKFLIFKAVVEEGVKYGFILPHKLLLWVALVGVVVSLYYCLGVVRAIWWSKDAATNPPPLELSLPTRCLLVACVAGMLWLGLLPSTPLELVATATPVLK